MAQVQKEVGEFLRLYEDYRAGRLSTERINRYRELRGKVQRGEWVPGEKPLERPAAVEPAAGATVKPSLPGA